MINRLSTKVRRFLADESGPTSIEYAVMLMLILLVVIGTVQLVGDALFDSFQDSNNQIEQAVNG